MSALAYWVSAALGNEQKFIFLSPFLSYIHFTLVLSNKWRKQLVMESNLPKGKKSCWVTMKEKHYNYRQRGWLPTTRIYNLPLLFPRDLNFLFFWLLKHQSGFHLNGETPQNQKVKGHGPTSGTKSFDYFPSKLIFFIVFLPSNHPIRPLPTKRSGRHFVCPLLLIFI